jgi:hypothetical protein
VPFWVPPTQLICSHVTSQRGFIGTGAKFTKDVTIAFLRLLAPFSSLLTSRWQRDGTMVAGTLMGPPHAGLAEFPADIPEKDPHKSVPPTVRVGGYPSAARLPGVAWVPPILSLFQHAPYRGELIDTRAEFSTDGKIAFSAITGTGFPDTWHADGWVAPDGSPSTRGNRGCAEGTCHGKAGRRGRDCCPPAVSSLAVSTDVGDTLIFDRDCRIDFRRHTDVRFCRGELSRLAFSIISSESAAATLAKIPVCEEQIKKDGRAVLSAGIDLYCAVVRPSPTQSLILLPYACDASRPYRPESFP